jgi:hypothetical protein
MGSPLHKNCTDARVLETHTEMDNLLILLYPTRRANTTLQFVKYSWIFAPLFAGNVMPPGSAPP